MNCPSEAPSETIRKLVELDRKRTKGPWRAFIRNNVEAIFNSGRKEVVKWTGFEASDFQKERAANCRFIVALENAWTAGKLVARSPDAEAVREACAKVADAHAQKACEEADKIPVFDSGVPASVRRLGVTHHAAKEIAAAIRAMPLPVSGATEEEIARVIFEALFAPINCYDDDRWRIERQNSVKLAAKLAHSLRLLSRQEDGR